MPLRITATLLLAALVIGCIGRGTLIPAPGAQRLPGDPQAAVGTAAGVQLTVRASAWRGDPPTLSDAVTPLHVTFKNDSQYELRIRYQEITFSDSALDYSPLPPYKLAGETVTVTDDQPIWVPRFEHSRFFVAPYIPDVSGLSPWAYQWSSDRRFFERQYLKWTVSLPTVDMIERAMPEGVVQPGGSVSGFLYFEKFPRGTGQIMLKADLIDARTELTFGTIEIPFVLR